MLKTDQFYRGPAWKDARISGALEAVQTMARVRKQLVEERFDTVLTRRPYLRKYRRMKIDERSGRV